MVKHLYIMRHGETLFNVQKRVQGWCDSPLTQKGVEQAKQARAWFKKEGIQRQAVYASTQERAFDTAHIIAEHDNIKTIKGLKEMNFGQFEAQPEQLLPKFRQGAHSFEDLLVPYGGEDIAQVGQRVQRAVLDTAASETADSIIMVSHGAALWGMILQLNISFPQGTRFGNCAICDFTYDKGRLALNRVVDPITETEVVV
ncbi:histidine phosphatase family protein [Streptococcus dentasini]